MKQRAILLIFVMLAVVGVVLSIAFSPAVASSHREAPFITEHPEVDGTDFYMFRSYEEGRDGFVTLIANYLPLQDPYGGPNYFTPYYHSPAVSPDGQTVLYVHIGAGQRDLVMMENFQ